MDFLGEIWWAALTPSALPSHVVAAVCVLIALVATAWPPAWGLTRHAVTIVHEAGHGLLALLTGRRLAGIRLHSDTSGLTLSVGKPRGFGMVLTAAAGYPAPALLGLGAAALLAHGYAAGMLWALVVLLALVLVQIRNWFGLWSILVSAGVVVGVSLWAPAQLISAAALIMTCFFLLAAPRTVVELFRERRRSRSRSSDADVLARLTPFPALFWGAVFMLIALGTLLLSGTWLVPVILAG